jgi:two-component system response regulator FixJ
MSGKTVFVVDDDESVRHSLRDLLESAGYKVIDFGSAIEFLAADEARGSCVVADIRMPRMSGLEMQDELSRRGSKLPVIIMTGHGDVPLAVRAMKAGAVDFLEKPYHPDKMLASIENALAIGRRDRSAAAEASAASELVAQLTPREIEVLEQLVAGRSNKLSAQELGISPRTVEIHRARIMDKLRAQSLSDLVRMAIAASLREAPSLRGKPN